MTDEEVSRYKKRTKSDTSKAQHKSNHKHISKECLLVSENKPYLASYCTICGKIQKWTEPVVRIEVGTRKYWRLLTNQEVFEKYRNLERIEVEDIWVKYIPIHKDM